MSKAERHTKRLKIAAKIPGPWRELTVTAEMRAEAPHLARLAKRFYNRALQVDLFNCASPIGGVVHAVVLRHGLVTAPSSQELQDVKNSIFGPETEAVEVYPANTGEVPTSIRHLWIMPTTYSLPFGYTMPNAWGD